MEGCQLTTMFTYAFHRLTSLRIHHLSYNDITYIEYDTFDLLFSLTELYLSKNQITEISRFTFNFGEQHRFGFLDFSKQNSLQVLDLSRNSIKQISDGAFEFLTNLTELYLYRNQITAISNLTFSIGRDTGLGFIDIANQKSLGHNSALHVLDLSWNRISHIADGAFESLSNLQVLNLSFNHISHISDGSFKSLFNLQALNLSWNSVSHISDGAFHSLISLTDLDFQNNSISAISELIFTNEVRNKLQRLYLRNNKLVCNCSLFWLYKWFCQRQEVFDSEGRYECTNLKGTDILAYSRTISQQACMFPSNVYVTQGWESSANFSYICSLATNFSS
jgi:Leucine-rich repeat (LRR) protein